MKNISIFTHRSWMIVFRPVRRQNLFANEELKSTDDSVTHDRDGYALFFISIHRKQQQTQLAWKQQHQRSRDRAFPTQAHKRGKLMSGKLLLLIITRSEHRRELNQQNVNLSRLCGWWMMCANVRQRSGFWESSYNFRVFFVHFVFVVWPSFTA